MSNSIERKVQCDKCKNKFYKSELVYTNKNKRCKPCVEDVEQRKDLIEYMVTGFGIPAPTGRQLSDIKRFRAMGISYLEMKLALYYMAVVEGFKFNNDKDITMLTDYVTKARKHHRDMNKIRESLNGANLNVEEVEVDIGEGRKPRISKTRLIDISQIM